MTSLFRRVGLALCLCFGLTAANAQAVLPQLNPTLLDTSFLSTSGSTPALIDFVNLEPFAVDIYWINYTGDRVFYDTLGALSSYYQPTFLTHPWIAAVAGSGDTLAQGTGTLLDGFLAVTANPSQLTSLADTAYIGPVPEPETYALMLVGLAVLGASSRKKARSVGARRQ